MATKTTHPFKALPSLTLNLDIYARTTPPPNSHPTSSTPILLFFHGGGLVSNDRSHIPPHIVQSALLRNWLLVSADYRVLPQTKGIEVLEDIKDAYTFVRGNVFGIINKNGMKETMKNIIVAGPSAGGYWTYQAGHYCRPRPIALLIYYGIATSDDIWFRSNTVITPPAPILESQIQHFLDESENCGYTPEAKQFDPVCLLEDLTLNPEWRRAAEEEGLPRDVLYFYLLQNNLFPGLLKGVDKSVNDEAWKDYPKTIIVHGDQDEILPFRASVDVVGVIGPTPATLFRVEGKRHGFDSTLFLGDLGLEVVEEAWRVLDEVVEKIAAA